jgi:hypothetical protein
MKLCDYSIFPSSWETESSEGNDECLSSLSLTSGCEELLAASPLDNSMTNKQPSFPTLAAPPTVTLMAPPMSQDPNFVNVYMVVDPTKQTVTFPQQIVTYKTGDNVVSMAVVGPFSITDQQIQALFQVAQAMTTTTATTTNTSTSISSATLLTNCPSLSSLPDTSPPSSATAPPLPPVTFSANAIQIALKSLNNWNINTTAAPLPPLKPLSAYNFFFRDERDRILNSSETPDSCAEHHHQHEHDDWSNMIKQQRLLHDHWSRDRHARRRHRKTHGKIDFTTLSRLISMRWKNLAEHRKDFYRQVASMDYARYQSELQQQEANQQLLQQQLLAMLPDNNASSSLINDYMAVVA